MFYTFYYKIGYKFNIIKMQEKEKIAIFPLGLVLLPNMFLPLHIFEDRYKDMINLCIKEEKDFGVIYYSGNKLSDIGCTAKISNINFKYSDGKMDIVTEGIKRFKIEKIYNDKPYLEADVTYFDDEYEIDGDALERSRKDGLKALKEIMEVYSGEKAEEYIDEFDAKFISFLIVANGGFSLEEKQEFLKMKNTRERLEKGLKSLETLLDRLKSTKKIQDIIKSNGYLPSKH